MQKLKQKGNRHPDHTKALSEYLDQITNIFLSIVKKILITFTVKEKLTTDRDSEIAISSLWVSLQCPVSEDVHFEVHEQSNKNFVFFLAW